MEKSILLRGTICVLLWIFSFYLFAQNLSVKGKVTDAKGELLIGVSVQVEGTTEGSITDANGIFTLLNVPVDATLKVTYVGMQTQTIPVKGRTSIDIVLEEDSEALEEVVVVGYGTQKKVNLTGSVSSIDIGKIATTRPITNLSAGLAGLAPGLYVRSQDNDPGSNATLMIRGQGTLNNSSPLIIIDGAEGDISRVSPQDIENISVLKDAASASIYGSRAANGVILITTKQGKSGKISINYDAYYAAQRVAHLMPFVSNSVEWMGLINEGAKNSKQA